MISKQDIQISKDQEIYSLFDLSKAISENKYVEILFEDSGPGIPDAERASIFEPFMSTKDQGTGLGLSVSYSILEAHGGNLELLNGEHAKHQGACFRIELPILEVTT